MKVYSRDDIEKYKDNLGKFGNEDEDGDDDEDEEEDEKFPKNLVHNKSLFSDFWLQLSFRSRNKIFHSFH